MEQKESVVEILVHTTAPSRIVDDARYRKYVAGYSEFRPVRRLALHGKQRAEHLGGGAGEEVVVQEDRRITSPRIQTTDEHESPAISVVQITSQRPTVFIQEPEDSSYVESQSQPPPPSERRLTRSFHRSFVPVASLPNETGSQSQSRPTSLRTSYDPSLQNTPRLSANSIQLSFASVNDNVDSPDFRNIPGFKATPPSGLWSQEKSWETPPAEVCDSMATVDKTLAEFSTPTRVLQLYRGNANGIDDLGQEDTQQWEEEARARDGDVTNIEDIDASSTHSEHASLAQHHDNTNVQKPSVLVPQSTDKSIIHLRQNAITTFDTPISILAANTSSNGTGIPPGPTGLHHIWQRNVQDPTSISSMKTTILETPFPQQLRSNFLSRLNPDFASPADVSRIEETPTRISSTALAGPSRAAAESTKAVDSLVPPHPAMRNSPSNAETPHFTDIFLTSGLEDSVQPQLSQPDISDLQSSQPLTPRPCKRPRLSNLTTIHPPLPKTNSLTLPLASTLLTPFLQHLTAQSLSTLGPRYTPHSQARPLRDTERGYWLFSVQNWPSEIFEEAWKGLGKIIKGGSAGWGIRMERKRTDDGETCEVGKEKWKEWRIYCWGKCVRDIWLVVYSLSRRWVRKGGSTWIDGEGISVVVMDKPA